MVTAGVFMVCRLSPMFETSETATALVTFVGAATALFAATVGTVQNDIKRVIAYSTCSQLGYMFFAAGVGAYGAAMFHLFTHAFFKALLFLGAGSVIHAMHHEQDMRFYGGLRRHIPLTFWAMMIGTLAITGVGVIQLGGGIPSFGFAGFFSKDAIIESAYMSGRNLGLFAFAVGVFAAFLTSFYSWRLVFLTFFGKPRWAASEHIQHALHDHRHDREHDHEADPHPEAEHAGHDTRPHEAHAGEIPAGTGGYHPHESPWSMLVPLGLLSLGAVAAGIVFHHAFIDAAEGEHFWAHSIYFDHDLMHDIHESPMWVKLAPAFVMLLGLFIAWNAYIRNPRLPASFVSNAPLLHGFLYNKWFFDEIYDRLFIRPSLALGRIFWKRGDEGTIDRFGPNGAAALVSGGNRLTARMQTGYLYTYALVMLLGIAAATTWAMSR
jgi:NADH-quinone oxidoreductase subunit L